MENFKVIIAGSRGFSNYKLLREKCNEYLREKRKISNIIIVSGHARGADTLGEKYAQDEGFSLEIYPAQWDKFGKRAGYRRNEQMAEVADALIAFWDGSSRGTKHMIDIMNEKNLLVRVVEYETSNKTQQKG
jgi:predicted Rossmann fold nucleotide-binding protein DprA/Smf involved in DNA uptake